MLKHLEIQNYALIERLKIDFFDGFSVLTGETGAGKSIIMGALSLVLGQRADAKVIQEGKPKCVVEVVFDVSSDGLESFFERNELDYCTETIVRREVQDNGKSRAFINDTPVTLGVLKELTEMLIDIHSQHENLLLTNDRFQLDIVDSVAKLKDLKSNYKVVYLNHKQLSETLSELLETAEKWRSEREYAQFQFAQMSEANLKENEQVDLESELNVLNHTEEIQQSLSLVCGFLDAEGQSVLPQLKDSVSYLQRIRDYFPQSEPLMERMESCRIDLKDVASELQLLLGGMDFNPLRKNEVEERLNFIYSLQQKHRVSTVGELLDLQSEFEQKLKRIDSFDLEIKTLQNKIDSVYKQMSDLANELTQKRLVVKTEIEHAVEAKLHLLGIPNAQFQVRIEPSLSFSASGKDSVQFLFTANKNAALKKITDIASGGEMSRVMLSVKSLIVEKSLLPTIIFDEIDTGVSGEVAQRMGNIMSQMANAMQVIAITHLPQIASQGAHHYKVYKFDTENKTVTNIVRLSNDDRISEIAEMLSGKNPSQAAVENARELLRY